MLISEFVPAGRIQLTNTSKGESKHFEVCSSESLFMFVLLKFEMQKPKCPSFWAILTFPSQTSQIVLQVTAHCSERMKSFRNVLLLSKASENPSR